MSDSIHDWIVLHRDLAIEALQNLVRMDTQNLAPDGHERSAQLAIAELLRMLDCRVDVYEIGAVPGILEHPQYWPARPCTGRPNVIGVRRGTGGGRSLLFSSHMDTVPVGLDPWTKFAWGGELSDGKLWGLGAYDMKAGLVASIMVIRALNDLGLHLRGDLMVESVVDEEFGGCNGTLAARLKYNADLAIVPEPTNLVVCPGHQGGLMLKVIFRGKPGWSFSPEQPIDPTSAIGRFVGLLRDWQTARQASLIPPALYQDNPSLPVMINQIKAGDISMAFFADRVPSHAWLCVWIGAYPGMTQEEVIRDLRAFYQRAQATEPLLANFEPIWEPLRWLAGSQISADHPGVEAFASITTAVCGEPAVIRGAPFACDGHIFNLFSPTPMFLLGPAGGNPHSPDEFVDINSYLRLIEIFIRGTLNWCCLA